MPSDRPRLPAPNPLPRRPPKKDKNKKRGPIIIDMGGEEKEEDQRDTVITITVVPLQ